MADAAGDSADKQAVADTLESCVTGLTKPSVKKNAPRMPIPLRIVSWNTQKHLHAGATAYLGKLSAKADLLLLQEALLDQPEETPLPLRAFSPGYTYRNTVSGVETRSHTPFDVQCKLQFREPWLRTPKAVSVARISYRDHALLVVNLHAINFTLGSRAYGEQLASLGALLDAHHGPVLLGGDLNNWNAWRGRTLDRFVDKYALSKVQFTPDWRSRHLGTPVDGVILRGLTAIDATALPTQLSDHHPLSVSLRPAEPPALNARTAGGQQAQTSASVPVTISQ